MLWGKSAAYVCDLEYGRRRWTVEKVAQYRALVVKAREERLDDLEKETKE